MRFTSAGDDTIEYRSKPGIQLWALVVILIICFSWPGFLFSPTIGLVLFVINVAVWSTFGLLIIRTTKYVFHRDHLTAKFLSIKVDTKYSTVESITRTDSLKPKAFLGFALTLDRIVIVDRSGGLAVSPADSEGFLRELRSRCPRARYKDERSHTAGKK